MNIYPIHSTSLIKLLNNFVATLGIKSYNFDKGIGIEKRKRNNKQLKICLVNLLDKT